ncbi:hypothetical protein [Alloalcanivorax xenomutans]|uniref:hypothetical protein n=1 Tax=Alloalcanivorax xenomutans TaxID=1094342 RepID=UPI001F3A5710|nr:hypothetical protein [Alloalcanivorax xenomutans]MCE7522371.1 hypothetical protein [Alloalcanivorax xenomutans]
MSSLVARYCLGEGEPPRYLAAMHTEVSSGELVFAGGGEPRHTLKFSDQSALYRQLRQLLASRLPVAAGGMMPGPVDEVAALIVVGCLEGPYVVLAWSGPGQWILREHIEGAEVWRKVADSADWVNVKLPLN